MNRPTACLLACLILLSAGIQAASSSSAPVSSAAASASTAREDLAALALAALQDAARTRAAHDELEASWRHQAARLAALTAAAEADAAALRERTRALQSQGEALSATLAGLAAPSHALAAAQARLARAAASASQALADLAATHVPGAIVLPDQDDIAAVLAALTASELAARSIAVEIVVGRVGLAADAPQRAVRLLRIGGACAFWAALEPLPDSAANAGPAQMQHGELRLLPVSALGYRRAADVAAAIQRAIAAAQGTGPASLELLPLPP